MSELRESRRSPEVDRPRSLGWLFHSFSKYIVEHSGDGVVESDWTTTAYSCGLEVTQDKGKIELYTCACQPIVSDVNRMRKKAQLWRP